MSAPMTAQPNLSAQYDRPRKWGFTTAHDLHCPQGHRIREDAFVLDQGAFRCKHRPPLQQTPEQRRRRQPAGHGPECGAWVYVLACAGWSAPQVQGDGLTRPTLLFVAEVHYGELLLMQERRLELKGVLEFLGVGFLPPSASP